MNIEFETEKLLILDKKLLNEASKLYPHLNAATDFHNYMIVVLEKAGFKLKCNNDFSSGLHEFAGFKISEFHTFEITKWQLFKILLREFFKKKNMPQQKQEKN